MTVFNAGTVGDGGSPTGAFDFNAGSFLESVNYVSYVWVYCGSYFGSQAVRGIRFEYKMIDGSTQYRAGGSNCGTSGSYTCSGSASFADSFDNGSKPLEKVVVYSGDIIDAIRLYWPGGSSSAICNTGGSTFTFDAAGSGYDIVAGFYGNTFGGTSNNVLDLFGVYYQRIET